MEIVKEKEMKSKKTSIFKNRNFMFLLIVTVFSAPGYYIYLIAAEWMMLSINDNRFYFGLLFFAAAVPRLLFMLVGGIVADRFNKRTILFVASISRTLLILCLIGFIFLDVVTVWHLIVLACFFGIADAFSYPVTSSLLPTILQEDQLQQGNSFIQMSGLISPIVGAAIGGTLIATLGFKGVFSVSFVLMLIASITVTFIRVKQEKAAVDQTAFEDLKEGFQYVRASELIMSIIFLALVINLLFTGPIAMGIPMIVKDVLHGSPIHLGIVEAAMGIGALIGVILLVSITIKRTGIVMLGSVIALGVFYTMLGFAQHLYMVTALVVLMSFLIQVINIPLITTLQRTTEKKLLGRMMSFLMFTSTGLVPVSFLMTSMLVAYGVSIQYVMMSSGILITILALYNVKNKKIVNIQLQEGEKDE